MGLRKERVLDTEPTIFWSGFRPASSKMAPACNASDQLQPLQASREGPWYAILLQDAELSHNNLMQG